MKFITLSFQTISPLLVIMSISSISFFVPFYFGHNQLLMGTLINTGLFLSFFTKEKSIRASVIFLPSMATVIHGVLFGSSTMFLLYFLPFIWFGNFLLIILFGIFKKLFGFLPGVFAGTAGKSIFLFFCANIFIYFGIVPKIFLSSMGILQGVTALFGGIVSFILIQMFYDRSN